MRVDMTFHPSPFLPTQVLDEYWDSRILFPGSCHHRKRGGWLLWRPPNCASA